MNTYKPGPLLSKINVPQDLRNTLSPEELPSLCQELRQYLVDIVSEKGGHFGASLGVMELTVALHYVFQTPYDQVVWDVGHQAYGHKILTGRKDSFYTNRKYKGLSGFPKRSESEFDTFGVGHSSTSISAALGMAVASRIKNEKNRHVVAVIGDGAMTGGEAFEGLNHGGVEDANLLVVLNDNCMGIDPVTGALKEYLTDITSSPTYNRVKEEIWGLLGKMSKFGPNPQAIAHKISDVLKSSLIKESNLFEALKWRYFGPVDGHNVKHLVEILKDLREIPGPKLLHCITVKGKGYEPAEKGHATLWHAPGLFNKENGEIIKPQSTGPKPPLFQDVFGHSIIELAQQNERIVGVTPAMLTGCSLKFMMEHMPERTFDVGIAEQHAVTFSAGLATQGLIPFCNIYSTFMQRAYDQIIHDVALQKLHVIFCLDRGGLVGADGPTHHGTFDIAYMRCVPNMIVSSPMNEMELRNLMYTAQRSNTGPFSIRYPRGNGVTIDWRKPFEEIKIGMARKLRDGKDIAILSLGPIGNQALEACNELEQQGISAAHYDMRFAKPIDTAVLHEVFKKFKYVITVEDGCIQGGMGSAVLEFMADHGYSAKVMRLGVPDRFIEHGTQDELYAECGFDKKAMKEAALSFDLEKSVSLKQKPLSQVV